MKIYYKDYEFPSFELRENGYLMPKIKGGDEQLDPYSNEVSNFIIKSENNSDYFDEANILTKINLNEENYFDFNKAIIDIGAYVGYYSFRSNFNKGYAFEPNKFISVFTQINLIMHNKFDNFKVYNALLSNNKTPIKFDGFNNEYTFEEDLNDVELKLNKDNIYIHDVNLVVPHMLDEYNCQDVGLIKIDVEGMEEKVLRGGLGTIIRNNYPPILFECWDVGTHLIDENGHLISFYNINEDKHNSLQKFLEDLGYEILWNWGNEETHLAINKKFYNK